MQRLHILQGGVRNGDKTWLERAARKKLTASNWIAPKSAQVGDEVVIYIPGIGLFATAQINSQPKPKKGWKNRYAAGIHVVKLIEPPISIAAVLRHLPRLTWARYPRSITTPHETLASQIRDLIATRRRTGLPDLDDDSLASANLDELRKVAILAARKHVTGTKKSTWHRVGSLAIKRYILCRANGICEGCSKSAPFRTVDGSPYLEPHHTHRMADGGPDHPKNVVGLCANCHRRAHYSVDASSFNRLLIKKAATLEDRRR
jgi:hypothetical protein